jgi:transposase
MPARNKSARRTAPPPPDATALPVHHPHAAGIDVGDRSHWVCVGEGEGDVREFPAHTAGLRDLVGWLRQRGVTAVALEATGVYGHVLFLTLLEGGFDAVVTAPKFTRQIQGRPKTDRRDCQWIFRLHAHGLLPPVFQPDDTTQTLREYVRQRGNLVRLSAQHVQRMQKALELMNLKLTHVVGDVTGVTGLRVVRAILAGERDPRVLARLRDRRCKRTEAEIAVALDGRYRAEYVTLLRTSLALWEAYHREVTALDGEIETHLRGMKRASALPPLPHKIRVRGRRPHDPAFDVRTALYYATGVDLTQVEGIDAIHALTLVGELGADFSKWPSVKHFTSWLGLCPNVRPSGGKVTSSATRRGKNRAAHALRLAAWGLMRGTSGLGAYLRRQRSRLGAPKAVTATAHKLARIVYALVRFGGEYVKKSEAEYTEQVRGRLERQLKRRAKELGFEVVKAAEAPTDSPVSVAPPASE